MTKIPSINEISYGRKFVRGMAKSGVMAPIIILEACVTGGRTIQAFKRGGFTEGRERLTEETLGAIFWLGGVEAFNRIGDKVGKHILKLGEVSFDTGKDSLRNPFGNFVKAFTKVSKNKLAAFKFGKIATSVLLANAFVGFIVPKMNQAITRKFQAKDKAKFASTHYTNTSFAQFLEKSQKDKAPSFGSIQPLLTLTHNIENHAIYKLLSTDIGITSGRAINARNRFERAEILFRDISSLYFYMFCTKHLSAVLNKVQDGKWSRLDPVATKQLSVHLDNFLDENNLKDISPEEFKAKILGKAASDVKLPEGLKFTQSGKGKKAMETILLKDFEAVEKNPKIIEIAKRMAKLQPELPEGAVLSKTQLIDVYRGGAINTPEFLNEMFKATTGGKSVDPYKYIPQSSLDKLKREAEEYVEILCEKTGKSGKKITKELIKKLDFDNLLKNSTNLGIGMVVSAAFLSTFIPKIQYLMTKRKTGSNEFPGVSEEMNSKNYNKA